MEEKKRGGGQTLKLDILRLNPERKEQTQLFLVSPIYSTKVALSGTRSCALPTCTIRASTSLFLFSPFLFAYFFVTVCGPCNTHANRLRYHLIGHDNANRNIGGRHATGTPTRPSATANGRNHHRLGYPRPFTNGYILRIVAV